MDKVYCSVEEKEIEKNEDCVENCDECLKLQEQLIKFVEENIIK